MATSAAKKKTKTETRYYTPEELSVIVDECAEVRFVSEAKQYGLVAKRRIAAGDNVIRGERPLVSVMTTTTGEYCYECFGKLLRKDEEGLGIPCDNGCGVSFCSQECLDRVRESHALLCTGLIDEEVEGEAGDHPLFKFKVHAAETNVNFLMAGKLIAMEIANPAATESALERFERPLWTEAVAVREDDDHRNAQSEDGETFATMRRLMEESRNLLLSALRISFPKVYPHVMKGSTSTTTSRLLTTVCSEENFSRLMGLFERNQFEIAVDPARRDGGDDEHEENDPDDWARGVGIFSLACTLNHDCLPNCEIVFPEGDNRATVVALRDVPAGEELTVCYLDLDENEDDEPTRAAALRDYGFRCTCVKCGLEREQVELAARVVQRCDRPDFVSTVRLVAGFDVSFPTPPPRTFSSSSKKEHHRHDEDLETNDEEEAALACLVIMRYPDCKEVVYERLERVRLSLPYVPGLLSFREAPVALEMLSKVPPHLKPDVLMMDGCGVMHPRGCGLASHVGVLADIPTLGVAKELFAVDGLTRESVREATRGMTPRTPVKLVGRSGRVVGAALLPTPEVTRPVFVSVGHRLDLDAAGEIVLATSKHRIPEPIREADLTSRRVLRDTSSV